MKPGRARRAGFLSLVLFLLLGCERIDVDATVESATRLLRAVRPGADVRGVGFRKLRPWHDPSALLDDLQRAEVALRRRCLIEHEDLLREFRVLESGDFEGLLERLDRGAFVERSAFANYRHGLVWLPAADLGSIEVIARELSRFAALGRHRGEELHAHVNLAARPTGLPVSLRGRWDDSAARVDLDALLALDILRETEAAFTAEAVSRYRADLEGGLAELWSEPVHLEGEGDSSPGALPSSPSLLEAVDDLAERGSRSLVQAHHRPGEGIEPALDRVWSGFSYTTREILFPRLARQRSSRFAASARHLDSRVGRVVRVGSFLTWRMLRRVAGLPRRHVLDVVRGLEDDILVAPSDRRAALWITEWTGPEAAESFSLLYRPILESGRVEVDGNLVIASFGEIGDRERILRTLR